MVRECISSPSFSIVINDKFTPWFETVEFVKVSTLFVSISFWYALLDKEIKGKFSKGTLQSFGGPYDVDVSLLPYADDVLLIVKAFLSNCGVIVDSLDNFKTWTGLQFNVHKSNIMLSPSLHPCLKKLIIKSIKMMETPTNTDEWPLYFLPRFQRTHKQDQKYNVWMEVKGHVICEQDNPYKIYNFIYSYLYICWMQNLSSCYR